MKRQTGIADAVRSAVIDDPKLSAGACIELIQAKLGKKTREGSIRQAFYNARANGSARRRAKLVRRPGDGFTAVLAATAFIRACGGIDSAKAQLQAVEDIIAVAR